MGIYDLQRQEGLDLAQVYVISRHLSPRQVQNHCRTLSPAKKVCEHRIGALGGIEGGPGAGDHRGPGGPVPAGRQRGDEVQGRVHRPVGVGSAHRGGDGDSLDRKSVV